MDNIKEMLLIANFNEYKSWEKLSYEPEGMYSLPHLISFDISDTKVSKSKVIRHWLKAYSQLSWTDKMYFIFYNFVSCIYFLLGFFYKLFRAAMVVLPIGIFIALILTLRWEIRAAKMYSWEWNIEAKIYGFLWFNKELLILGAILSLMLVILIPKLDKSSYKRIFTNKMLSIDLITIWTKTADGKAKPVDFIYSDLTDTITLNNERILYSKLYLSTENIINTIVEEKISIDELRNNFNKLKLFDRFLLSGYHESFSSKKVEDELIKIAKYEYYNRKDLDLKEIAKLRKDANI